MIDEQAMPTLMTATQLSKMFGVHVNTIWRWVEQGRFPRPVRVSPKIVRFRAEDVKDFLKNES